MYASRTTQFVVGLFGLLGILALAFLSFRLGRIEIFEPPGYTIYGNFDTVAGLKVGDVVNVAGVKVGRVSSIHLDHFRARVGMHLQQGVEVDNEAIASIKTSGIIGDKYISISLGAGDKMLAGGDTLHKTESAFVLEDAIGQLINSTPSNGSKKEGPSEKGANEKGTNDLQ